MPSITIFTLGGNYVIFMTTYGQLPKCFCTEQTWRATRPVETVTLQSLQRKLTRSPENNEDPEHFPSQIPSTSDVRHPLHARLHGFVFHQRPHRWCSLLSSLSDLIVSCYMVVTHSESQNKNNEKSSENGIATIAYIALFT